MQVPYRPTCLGRPFPRPLSDFLAGVRSSRRNRCAGGCVDVSWHHTRGRIVQVRRVHEGCAHGAIVTVRCRSRLDGLPISRHREATRRKRRVSVPYGGGMGTPAPLFEVSVAEADEVPRKASCPLAWAGGQVGFNAWAWPAVQGYTASAGRGSCRVAASSVEILSTFAGTTNER